MLPKKAYWLGLITLFSFFLMLSQQPNPVQSEDTVEWSWPLYGDFQILQNQKYGTTVENTDYDIRNLDLMSVDRNIRIGTCFYVGFHRLFHAGVDLYQLDEDGNISTEIRPVRSIADGVVVSIEGVRDLAIIVSHPSHSIYSVYQHLESLDNMGTGWVSVGETVTAGQTIGHINYSSHEGRYGEFHPNGNDSHLHFEIRTMEDAGNIFPDEYDGCNTGLKTGVGYTYPDSPDNYGYLDPVAYLTERLVGPSTLLYETFLPLVRQADRCIEGEPLLRFNGGFENPVDNIAPWLSHLSLHSANDPPFYNLVERNSAKAFTGYNYAGFGDNFLLGGYALDEELLQSVRIPAGVEWLEWRQWVHLEQTNGLPGISYGTEFGDRHILTLKDAETGKSVIADQVIDHTSTDYENYVWLDVTFNVTGAEALRNRWVSVDYSHLSDQDNKVSGMRVDGVSLVMHCSDMFTDSASSEESLTYTVPVVEE